MIVEICASVCSVLPFSSDGVAPIKETKHLFLARLYLTVLLDVVANLLKSRLDSSLGSIITYFFENKTV